VFWTKGPALPLKKLLYTLGGVACHLGHFGSCRGGQGAEEEAALRVVPSPSNVHPVHHEQVEMNAKPDS
jgi:hypothetical protein